jgi:DNA-binding XRE family transcriptional regulator
MTGMGGFARVVGEMSCMLCHVGTVPDGQIGRRSVLIEIGRRLRERRCALGLTQETLARRADVSRGYLSDIERGKRDVSVTVLVRLLDAMRSDHTEGQPRH